MAAKAATEVSPLTLAQSIRASQVAWIRKMYPDFSVEEIMYVVDEPTREFEGSVAGTVLAKPYGYTDGEDKKPGSGPMWRIPKNGV